MYSCNEAVCEYARVWIKPDTNTSSPIILQAIVFPFPFEPGNSKTCSKREESRMDDATATIERRRDQNREAQRRFRGAYFFLNARLPSFFFFRKLGTTANPMLTFRPFFQKGRGRISIRVKAMTLPGVIYTILLAAALRSWQWAVMHHQPRRQLHYTMA